MDFNDDDNAAISASLAAGIRRLARTFPDNRHAVETLLCPPALNAEKPAELLAAAIEAYDRLMGDLTICLQIEHGDQVPQYVAEGVQLVADSAYPAKMIVICGEASTHGAGPQLSTQLKDAVRKSCPGGMIWHPLEGKPVFTH